MKKNLTKNIPLKIMSIIVGILVWLIVVNVDDPIITKGFVISDVQIINEDVLKLDLAALAKERNGGKPIKEFCACLYHRRKKEREPSYFK